MRPHLVDWNQIQQPRQGMCQRIRQGLGVRKSSRVKKTGGSAKAGAEGLGGISKMDLLGIFLVLAFVAYIYFWRRQPTPQETQHTKAKLERLQSGEIG